MKKKIFFLSITFRLEKIKLKEEKRLVIQSLLGVSVMFWVLGFGADSARTRPLPGRAHTRAGCVP